MVIRYDPKNTSLLLITGDEVVGKVRVGYAAIYPSTHPREFFYKMFALDEGASIKKVSPGGTMPIIHGTATDLSPGQLLTKEERQYILEALRKGETPEKIAEKYGLE